MYNCDFVLRSEWSLINIPGTMGFGPNKLLVVKGFNLLECLEMTVHLLYFVLFRRKVPAMSVDLL